MKQHYLTENTQELAKKLIESVSKQELIDFICQADSSFTTATAENFIDYIKQQQASGETWYKTSYNEFVLAVVSYGCLESAYNFEKIATEKMERFKQTRESQAKKDAEKYREDARKSNFQKLMVDYYLGRKDENEVKTAIFGKNEPSSRQYKRHDERKTFQKIQKKMETKSHDLSKILKLIDDDLARGYARCFSLTDEQVRTAEKIENSHGFVNRW